MFHRVKTEDQPNSQPNFSQRSEDVSAPVQEERPAQRSFVPSEPVNKEPVKKEMAKQEQAPQPQQPVLFKKEPQVQTQQPQQQPQQKEAVSMNTPRENAYRDDNNAQDTQSEQNRALPGGYQTAGQRVPGGYPGAYPGSSAFGAKPAAAPEARTNNNVNAVLTIGRGIAISGEIESCEHLIVEGSVEAALKGAKMLDVAETGTFYGTVEIEKATIAGRFEGDLTVNGRLTVRSTGSIIGGISYKELEVESGAVLDGRITPLKVREEAARKNTGKEASSTAAKARDFRASAQQQEAANTDEGLFGGKVAAAE